MSEQIRVCFVCTGNICRSPTAEAIFLHLIEAQGLRERFVVDSAGTGSWHEGELAHPDTRAAAQARGVKVLSRARQFVPADFDAFDYVIAMDDTHVASLTELGGQRGKSKIHLFRDFDAKSRGKGVPDPYYVGNFDEVFDICHAAAQGLLASLRESHALP